MHNSRKMWLLVALLILSAVLCVAQFRMRGGGRRYFDGESGPIVQTEGGESVNEDTVRTARETAPHSVDLPEWTNSPAFHQDVFTFARVIFKSRPGRPSWLGWVNDYPDADLNLSARLQMLTSMKVDADCRVLKLTDPDLPNYPFIFMSHPEGIELSDPENSALRKYLLNGGALVTDDVWGDRNWEGFETAMKTVLPGRNWIELPMTHPLFRCVFDLSASKQNLQVPSMPMWRRGYDPESGNDFPSAFRGEGSREVHIRAWLDDKQRIMALSLVNTDNGDGWEREGEDATYFNQFSETRAYPLAINVIFYLMTH